MPCYLKQAHSDMVGSTPLTGLLQIGAITSNCTIMVSWIHAFESVIDCRMIAYYLSRIADYVIK